MTFEELLSVGKTYNLRVPFTVYTYFPKENQCMRQAFSFLIKRSNPATAFQLANIPKVISNAPPSTAVREMACTDNLNNTNVSNSIVPPTPRHPNPNIALSVAKNG